MEKKEKQNQQLLNGIQICENTFDEIMNGIDEQTVNSLIEYCDSSNNSTASDIEPLPIPASPIGMHLHVTADNNQGGRKYMEDVFSVAYHTKTGDIDYAFIGVFDGHGGTEAANFAKKHLMAEISNHKLFWSREDQNVLHAIRESYIATHYAMWREQHKWPTLENGLPCTAGTTATIAIIRQEKIYIGHVGDSGIVLGYKNENEYFWRARQLTTEHKPDSEEESKRIMKSGGKVVVKSGVARVVWNRPQNADHKGPINQKTPTTEIPFLAVSRSLGDLWSYNAQINEFVVSPDPEMRIVKINRKTFKCLIFGSDGLWNVISPDEAINLVHENEGINECLKSCHIEGPDPIELANPSKSLVEKALETWSEKNMRADNITAVTVTFDAFANGDNTKKRITNTKSCSSDIISTPYLYHMTYDTIAAKFLPPKEYCDPKIFKDNCESLKPKASTADALKKNTISKNSVSSTMPKTKNTDTDFDNKWMWDGKPIHEYKCKDYYIQKDDESMKQMTTKQDCNDAVKQASTPSATYVSSKNIVHNSNELKYAGLNICKTVPSYIIGKQSVSNDDGSKTTTPKVSTNDNFQKKWIWNGKPIHEYNNKDILTNNSQEQKVISKIYMKSIPKTHLGISRSNVGSAEKSRNGVNVPILLNGRISLARKSKTPIAKLTKVPFLHNDQVSQNSKVQFPCQTEGYSLEKLETTHNQPHTYKISPTSTIEPRNYIVRCTAPTLIKTQFKPIYTTSTVISSPCQRNNTVVEEDLHSYAKQEDYGESIDKYVNTKETYIQNIMDTSEICAKRLIPVTLQTQKLVATNTTTLKDESQKKENSDKPEQLTEIGKYTKKLNVEMNETNNITANRDTKSQYANVPNENQCLPFKTIKRTSSQFELCECKGLGLMPDSCKCTSHAQKMFTKDSPPKSAANYRNPSKRYSSTYSSTFTLCQDVLLTQSAYSDDSEDSFSAENSIINETSLSKYINSSEYSESKLLPETITMFGTSSSVFGSPTSTIVHDPGKKHQTYNENQLSSSFSVSNAKKSPPKILNGTAGVSNRFQLPSFRQPTTLETTTQINDIELFEASKPKTFKYQFQ